LTIREKALGADHPDVAESLNNLAELYRSQARYADAEPLYQRSLAILEKALGDDHASVATLLNNFAELYRAQARYADAEPLHQRSLAIRGKVLGRDHPDVAISLNNLALLYRNQGRYADAEPLYQRSLAIVEKAFGREHPRVAHSLNNLAELYGGQRRYADALLIIRRTLSQGTANKIVAFPVLLALQEQNVVDAAQTLSESYEIVQQASGSAAGGAVSKLAARFAAGSDELAQLVRHDQDLTAEAEALDKTVIAFVSRSSTAEI
jgi:tetratricopeptide (TPR) repeat protein